jgi:hypothetical protein
VVPAGGRAGGGGEKEEEEEVDQVHGCQSWFSPSPGPLSSPPISGPLTSHGFWGLDSGSFTCYVFGVGT